MMTTLTAPGEGKIPEHQKTLLLTNDDGIHASGIKSLYRAFIENSVVITAAPDRERSGVGHAFTFNQPLHYETTAHGIVPDGYVVSGTPVDCVKFAVSHLLKKTPDVVVAGLNIGENSGLSAFYSGTVAAAREGAFWNIPSFAFSLCEEGMRYQDDYAHLAPGLLFSILNSKIAREHQGKKVFYNINFPACAPDAIKGIKVTRQSLAFFDDRYKQIEDTAHYTGVGFIIYGEKKEIEVSNDYDSRALMNGYITITPLCLDATAHDVMDELRFIEKND